MNIGQSISKQIALYKDNIDNFSAMCSLVTSFKM